MTPIKNSSAASAGSDLEAWVNAPGRDELVREVRQKIDALGIEYLYFQFISVTGRFVGKGIPAQHWERTANKGFQLVYGSTANLFTDRHGQYIGYGLPAQGLQLAGARQDPEQVGLRPVGERDEVLGGQLRPLPRSACPRRRR